MTTIETAQGTRTWKGDPNDLGAIAAWKRSYEPGYKSQVISPRDKTGSYTSDPIKIENFRIISREQQAKEIAASLKTETEVPANIVQSLAKTLGIQVNKAFHTDAPTGITDTKRITGDDTIGGNLITGMHKIPFIIVGLIIIVVFSFKLTKMK